MNDIAIVIGTRPELIKMAPVMRELTKRKLAFTFIHSNQHYSKELDENIMKNLGLPSIDYHLDAGSGLHSAQTGKIMEAVERLWLAHPPKIVVVHGDTNTTLGAALAAVKLHIPVCHIEAGLRSFDNTMPEEINRILTDRISDTLFSPTQTSQQNLLKEGVDSEKIVVTGNTVVDSLQYHLKIARRKSAVLQTYKLEKNHYLYATVHRPENVDVKEQLQRAIELLVSLSKETEFPVFFPVHPRTRLAFEKFGISIPTKNITLVAPLDYLDTIVLLENAACVITDSGGIQEEAYILKRPLITIRTSTERPETLSANVVVGLDKKKALLAWKAFQNGWGDWTASLGDGHAAEIIVDVLERVVKKGKKTTISVIGLGYIGLPTACLLAQAGHTVRGYDLDKRKIDTLQRGKAPFEEHGIQELLEKVRRKGTFTADLTLKKSDVYLIAVPTPDVHHKADLRFVFQAIEAIKPMLEDGSMVIIESTIAPRASMDEILPRLKTIGKRILLAHCPERAIPGNTLGEMVMNDRIVGGATPEATRRTAELYASFVHGNIYQTDITTAECCKVMENTFRDVNIALANEFCKIAEEVGINIWEAITLANKHPRVHIHQPGPGVGGHCIPVDPWFFVGISKQARLIRAARDTNDEMPHYVVKNLLRYVKKHGIKKPVIGVLGLSYKKNVDDARETPATAVLDELKKANVPFLAHDPYVKKFSIQVSPLQRVLRKANALMLITDHDQYLNLALPKDSPVKFIYDTRNVLTLKYDVPVYTLGNRAADRVTKRGV
jgi:UDP-N-acetylglucosamine 2-epimerase (non-hydrolysing)